MAQEITVESYLSGLRIGRWRASPMRSLVDRAVGLGGEDWALNWLFESGSHWVTVVTRAIRPEAEFDEITKVINEHLALEDWGWMSFSEGDTGIEVTHHAGPFVEIFGLDGMLFASELMRGFYSAILRELSGVADLELRLDETRSGVNSLVFVIAAFESDR